MDDSDYIAFSSAVIAGLALATSIWQGFVTRKHARLSARPIIEAEAHARRDAGITLVNSGFGPARLTKLTVELRGHCFNLLKDAGHAGLTDVLVADIFDREEVHHFVPRPRSTIGVGQRLQLVSIPAAASNHKLANQLAVTFREMTLNVEYESIYQEKLADIHVFKDQAD